MEWAVLGLVTLWVGVATAVYLVWRWDNTDRARHLEQRIKKNISDLIDLFGSRKTSKSQLQRRLSAAKKADRQPANLPMRWVGLEEVLQIHQITITTPLVYVGSRSFGAFAEPSMIDPIAPVFNQPDNVPRLSPDGLSYSEMLPEQKHAYLQWLAKGRNFLPGDTLYILLHFLGMERRIIMDQVDFKTVIHEVFRYLKLLANMENDAASDIRRSMVDFLCFLLAQMPQLFHIKYIRAISRSLTNNQEDQFAVCLSWFAQTGVGLPSWAAFQTASYLPQSRRGVVLEKVGNQFENLFITRYRKQFPDRIFLGLVSGVCDLVYEPRNPTIAPIHYQTWNALGCIDQLIPLVDLWNETLEALRPLSRVMRSGDGESQSAAAWEALPPDMRAAGDHPLTPRLCKLVESHSDNEGRAVVSLGELAKALDLPCANKPSIGFCRQLCERTSVIGYGVEPDARLTGKSYAVNDRLSLFLLPTDDAPDPSRLNAAACILRLGMAVAAADGTIEREQVDLITDNIERWFNLNPTEQRRLEALQALLEVEGPTLNGVQALTKSLVPGQRAAVGQLLLGLAVLDGIVTREELRTLRECYRTLNLPPHEIDRAIRTIEESRRNDPVTVKPQEPATFGEPIPPPRRGLRLDRELIERLEAESRQAAAMLAEEMDLEDEKYEEVSNLVTDYRADQQCAAGTEEALCLGSSGSLEAAEITVGGLKLSSQLLASVQSRYMPVFMELTRHDRLLIADAQAIARRHGMMCGAAVEVINDWSADLFGAPLIIEEGDYLVLDREVMENEQQ